MISIALSDAVARLMISLMIVVYLISATTRHVVAQPDHSVSTFNATIIAEWEPAEGVLVSWPFVLPDKLIKRFSDNVVLYVLVNQDKQSDAAEKIRDLRIPEDRVQYLSCSVDSGWPRDWGPHQMIVNDLGMVMVNQRFDGYPWYPQVGSEAEFTFRTGQGDDAVNLEIAPQLQRGIVECPAFVTGGNLLVDGHGTGFCTQAMLTENAKDYDENQLRRLFETKLGIDRLVVLENTEPVGIQHIDCWLKVIDAETLLVKQAPAGHPEEAALERNVEVLKRLTNVFGRKYRIERIYCPPVATRSLDPKDKPIAAYTNSLVLNKHVYVPLFDVPEDEVALATWRRTMPGYVVEGFKHSGKRGWMHFDALHCRSRAVFSKTMIRIEHPRLPADMPFSQAGYAISTFLQDLSGRGLDLEKSKVNFRIVGEKRWLTAHLLDTKFKNLYTAVIQPESSAHAFSVEYFVSAVSRSGQSVTHPRSAPSHYHQFHVKR